MVLSERAGRRLMLQAHVAEAAQRTMREATRRGFQLGSVRGLAESTRNALPRASKGPPLRAAAARMIQARLPGFARDVDPSEAVRFAAPIDSGHRLFIDLVKEANFGGGAGFSLQLGLAAGADESAIGFFELLGRFRPAWWRYGSKAELDAALAAAGDALGELVPTFRNACAELLASPTPPTPRTLGSRAAFEEARRTARAWAPDAQLDQLESGCGPVLRDELGPSLRADGLLPPHARWAFRFTSPSRREHFWQVISAVGPARGGSGPAEGLDPDPFLPETFADSREVVAAAEHAAASELRNGPPVFERILHMPPVRRGDPERIGVRYILVAGRTRRDVLVDVRGHDAGDPRVQVLQRTP